MPITTAPERGIGGSIARNMWKLPRRAVKSVVRTHAATHGFGAPTRYVLHPMRTATRTVSAGLKTNVIQHRRASTCAARTLLAIVRALGIIMRRH